MASNSGVVQKEDVLKILNELKKNRPYANPNATLGVAIYNVRNLPTADVAEVVHGRWLSAYEYALKIGVTDEERLEEVKKDKWWKFCNNCEQQVKGVRNYCPECGAKMDGKKVE